MTAGQVVGGPFNDLALLAPRGRRGSGPNDFPVNKTFSAVGIPREKTGSRGVSASTPATSGGPSSAATSCWRCLR